MVISAQYLYIAAMPQFSPEMLLLEQFSVDWGIDQLQETKGGVSLDTQTINSNMLSFMVGIINTTRRKLSRWQIQKHLILFVA